MYLIVYLVKDIQGIRQWKDVKVRYTAYLCRHAVTRSRKHCCYYNAIMCFFCIVVVSNTKTLSVAMETQEWVLFELLCSCTILWTTVNSTSTIRSVCKVADIFV